MVSARFLLRTLLASAVVFAAGCGERTAEPVATATPTPAATPTPVAAPTPAFGTFGLDEPGMDKSVAPGDDFFAYANGTWLKGFEIPADRSRYGMFTLLVEKSLARNRAILEDAAKNPDVAGKKLVGDFYAAYMDEATIESRDAAPVKPELDRIAAIADRKALATEIGGTLRADVDLMNATDLYTERLFGIWINQHLDRPNETVPYLVQGPALLDWLTLEANVALAAKELPDDGRIERETDLPGVPAEADLVVRAARRLGMSRAALYDRLGRYPDLDA